jgi:hypothetical protein
MDLRYADVSFAKVCFVASRFFEKIETLFQAQVREAVRCERSNWEKILCLFVLLLYASICTILHIFFSSCAIHM